MSTGKLQQTIAHFRRLLLQHNAQAEQALTAAYRTTLNTIKPQLDHLTNKYRQGELQVKTCRSPFSMKLTAWRG